MQTTRRKTAQYWATPLVGILIGVGYLVAFWVGGKPRAGAAGLTIMLVFSVGLVIAASRSETIRSLLDRQDERLSDIDLRATAFTALAMIVTVIAGFVIDIARGGTGSPYAGIGAVGGVAYVVAIVCLRLRR